MVHGILPVSHFESRRLYQQMIEKRHNGAAAAPGPRFGRRPCPGMLFGSSRKVVGESLLVGEFLGAQGFLGDALMGVVLALQ